MSHNLWEWTILGKNDKFLSEHQQEHNPQNVAQVPQLSPASFPLSHLQDLAQHHQPVVLSQQCFVNVVAMVMDTLFLRCVAVLHVAL